MDKMYQNPQKYCILWHSDSSLWDAVPLGGFGLPVWDEVSK